MIGADTLDNVDADARKGLLAPAAPPAKIELGAEKTITVGNYRVLASIGRGGMGEIYLAKSASEHFRGLVALKVLGIDAVTGIERLRTRLPDPGSYVPRSELGFAHGTLAMLVPSEHGVTVTTWHLRGAR